MRQITFILIGLFTISTLFIACKKDVEVDPGEPSLAEQFPGVPIGTIVPVEEREATLTRTASAFKSTNEINYWVFSESKIKVTGCGESETIDNLEGLDPSSLKIAFGADYIVYVMNNGVPGEAGGWQWSDPSTKNGIILDKYPEVTFTFTALNENEVVYASKQSGALEECSSVTAITYEKVVSP